MQNKDNILQQLEQLQAENKQLKQQLAAQKEATQTAKAKFGRFSKRGASLIIGSRLTEALRTVKNKTLSGKIPTSDDWLDVGAEVFYRLTRIGVFGAVMAIIPIAILSMQTCLMQNQNQLLTAQNSKLDTQNTIITTQNDLLKKQTVRLDTQNVLFSTQNDNLEYQNRLVAGQNQSLNYQNQLLFSQNIRIDTQNYLMVLQNERLGYQNRLFEKQNTKIDTQNYLMVKQDSRLAYQNTLFEKQNKRLDQQTHLQEAERRGNLVFLFSNVMDAIDRELTEDYGQDSIRNLSPQLIGRIVSLSQRLKPYRYMDGDTLITKPLSPERGQLLVNLVESRLDKNTYKKLWRKAIFEHADLHNTQFEDSTYLVRINLGGVNLERTDLRNADLSHANLENADLRGANLEGTDLTAAQLTKVNLSYADLKYTNLSYAKLNYAKLNYAVLSYATLKRTRISYADLSFSKLIDVNQVGSNIKYTNLSHAYLSIDWKKTFVKSISNYILLYHTEKEIEWYGKNVIQLIPKKTNPYYPQPTPKTH